MLALAAMSRVEAPLKPFLANSSKALSNSLLFESTAMFVLLLLILPVLIMRYIRQKDNGVLSTFGKKVKYIVKSIHYLEIAGHSPDITFFLLYIGLFLQLHLSYMLELSENFL